MSIVRIIPCIDMINGRVVKGKNFKNIVDVDSIDYLVEYYCNTGADEIIFYDINASIEKRKTDLLWISKIVSKINIPFCVGGGITSVEDVENCINIGAEKVSINSAAIKNPNLVKEIAMQFGSKRLVVAVDVKKNMEGGWNIYTNGGSLDTGLDAIDWIKKVVDLGAGEIVVNSIDTDGMKNGYDIELLKTVKSAVDVPIIASGGAGKFEDFYNVILLANVDGVLAASVFHYGEIKICDLKKYLKNKGISVINEK